MFCNYSIDFLCRFYVFLCLNLLNLVKTTKLTTINFFNSWYVSNVLVRKCYQWYILSIHCCQWTSINTWFFMHFSNTYIFFSPIYSWIKIVCNNRNRNHGCQFQHNRIRTALELQPWFSEISKPKQQPNRNRSFLKTHNRSITNLDHLDQRQENCRYF